MPNIRRTFTRGVMNKDVDERLLDDGFFRHAENIVINTSEGSDVGAIEKCLSNKQLTSLDLGFNPETVLFYSDESKNKLYWGVVSSNGCYLLEYDNNSNTVYYVLKDTRANRVLNFKRGQIITGVGKIISEDTSKDMLLWTDGNSEICCINIERAKTYLANGFQKEDIYLIKKPPRRTTEIRLTYESTSGNNIEDKFISFSYRWKYLDGEFSALAPFSNYAFEPDKLHIDYDKLENEGMKNKYNAVEITFDTGDKRVKEIQILAKESGSNNVYIIETFDKAKESWGNQLLKSMVYSNNKLYKVLPEKEYYKEFDNVPRKSEALTVGGNRVILGGYTEGYNMVDKDDNSINIDYSVSYNSVQVNKEVPIGVQYLFEKEIHLGGTSLIKKGYVLSFHLVLINKGLSPSVNGKVMIDSVFDYEFKSNLPHINSLIYSSDFQSFIDDVNVFIENNLINWSLNQDDYVIKYPFLTVELSPLNRLVIKVNNGIIGVSDVGEGDIDTEFGGQDSEVGESRFTLYEASKGGSLKSNRDYEVAIVYEDEFGRSSTALTSLTNTVYVAHEDCSKINKLRVTINNKPPYWAKRFRLAVKSEPLTYENIFISKFYQEDSYSWCKIEGSNKDKIKEGDVLILKKDSDRVPLSLIKVPVLEKKVQESDFIKGNKDKDGNDIEEEAGTYIKINPSGFSMSESDYDVNQDSQSSFERIRYYYPDVTLRMTGIPNWSDYKLNPGDTVYLWMESSHRLDSGWQENIFEKKWYINQNDYSLMQWFNDYIKDKKLYGTSGNDTRDYNEVIPSSGDLKTSRDKIKIVNIDGVDGMYIDGTHSANSGGRRGRLNAKIIVRKNEGNFIFETEPKKTIDTGIFYKAKDSFSITASGFHYGNIQIQSGTQPSIIELDFFNCFAFGGGLESYKIKDGFNTNALHIDLEPTSTSEEDYSEVKRYADLTYSEAFIESTGFNGLSSFNRSLINWKELDKKYGTIRKIVNREGNVLVFQDNKVGQVLYGKDAIYTSDGNAAVSKVPYILGDYVPYTGEYGMSHPESHARVASRDYWVDAKRGYVLRLSNNGISEITYGMENWFKAKLSQSTRSKILGGYDPYTKLYLITIYDKPTILVNVFPGSTIDKFNVSEVFNYTMPIPNLSGVASLNYNVTQGAVTIEAVHNGITHVQSNVSGLGELTIPVSKKLPVTGFSLLSSNLNEAGDDIYVSITPTTPTASYTVLNLAPEGKEQKVVTIVINNPLMFGESVKASMRWGSSSNFYDNISLHESGIALFQKEVGTQGEGKYPDVGYTIFMNANVKEGSNIDISKVKLRSLISDIDYSESDLSTILSNSTLLNSSISFKDKEFAVSGDFEYDNEGVVYLIYEFDKSDLPDNEPNIIDLSGVEFKNKTFIYDGTPKSIYVENLPQGVLASYMNNGKVDIGVYAVSAELTGDYDNLPVTMSALLTIEEDASSQLLPPSNFTVTKSADTSVYISFYRMEEFEKVRGHEIEFSIHGEDEWSEPLFLYAFDPQRQQGVSINRLGNDKTYDFRIRAVGRNNDYSDYVYQTIDMSL